MKMMKLSLFYLLLLCCLLLMYQGGASARIDDDGDGGDEVKSSSSSSSSSSSVKSDVDVRTDSKQPKSKKAKKGKATTTTKKKKKKSTSNGKGATTGRKINSIVIAGTDDDFIKGIYEPTGEASTISLTPLYRKIGVVEGSSKEAYLEFLDDSWMVKKAEKLGTSWGRASVTLDTDDFYPPESIPDDFVWKVIKIQKAEVLTPEWVKVPTMKVGIAGSPVVISHIATNFGSIVNGIYEPQLEIYNRYAVYRKRCSRFSFKCEPLFLRRGIVKRDGRLAAEVKGVEAGSTSGWEIIRSDNTVLAKSDDAEVTTPESADPESWDIKTEDGGSTSDSAVDRYIDITVAEESDYRFWSTSTTIWLALGIVAVSKVLFGKKKR